MSATNEVAQRRNEAARPGAWIPSAVLSAAVVVLGLARSPSRSDVRTRVEPAAHPHGAAEAMAGVGTMGWGDALRDALREVWGNIGTHRVLAIAAGVTFYALLAIFPAIAALVSLFGLFADPATISSEVGSMSSVVPGGAIEVVQQQIAHLASGGGSKLSLAFVVSLLISLWSANAGMKALFDALNVVYDAQERRGLLRLNAISLSFTLAAIVFFLVAMGAVVVVPLLLQHVPFGPTLSGVLRFARWPLLVVGTGLALAVLCRFGPDRDHARWRWITWGSASATVAWLCASLLFSWYAANFGSYNKTYGSLGAAVGFMTWMWISTTAILLGAEIDAVMERRHDGTASGQPHP